MDLLPPVDQRAISWHYSKQKAPFTTLPDRTSTLGRHEFAGAVALYLGLPDPLIVEFLASGGPRADHFRDQRGLRRLDSFGNNISLFMGKGHGRTCFHNEIQREVARLSRSVGYPIREIPADLFIDAIDPVARNRYLREIRETRERGVFRGGIQPDLYVEGSRQMFDVKTSGFKPELYIQRRSAVDVKAATVPGEYRATARKVDQDYNGTPLGTVGPVEAMLASMPQVECFSIGAFGEVNKAVITFLDMLATKGSETPERFGCCHGIEQANGIVAQFLGRRLGRTLMKGVVKMRHKALAAIGGIARPGVTEAQGMARNLGDEWDAAGRTWVPCF